MTKVIYVCPQTEGIMEFEAMTDGEKLNIAKNESGYEIYSLAEFQNAFNDGFISDEGFIYVVEN